MEEEDSTPCMLLLFGTIFISSVAFFVYLCIHILLWRLIAPGKKGVFLLLKIAFIAYISVTVFELLIESTRQLPLDFHLLTLCLYLLQIILYLHFYVGIDRSVSVRILGELAKSREKTMKLEEIQSRYSPIAMFEHRVLGLTAEHFLENVQGAYRCTKKGARLAKLALMLQKWYGLQGTG